MKDWNEVFFTIKAIAADRLFVIYHEGYSELPEADDITDIDPNDDIKLRSKSSPISLFFLNDKHDLEVIAIQMDDNKGRNIFR